MTGRMPPNLLILHCDELRHDLFRHRRYPVCHTPNLDRLIAQGTSFDQAFCQYPTCVPSRASFITGLYPQQLGVFHHGFTIPDAVPTLGDHLSAAGYEAVAFGRTHSQDKGFRRFPARSGKAAYGSDRPGFHADSDTITGTFRGPIEEHHDKAAALQFAQWLRRRGDERPYVAMMGFMSPHPPLYPPLEFAGRHDPDAIGLPSGFETELAAKPGKQGYLSRTRWLCHPEEVRRKIVARYLDMVEYLDTCVGDVLAAVEETGGETLIVFLADHGEMLGEHGMIGKWFSLYDDVIRVPFLFHHPGRIPAGMASDELVELVDLVPTLLDFAGVEIPASLPGRSLAPLLRGDPLPNPRDAVFSMIETARMIRTPEWKLAVHAGRGSRGYERSLFSDGEGELYDLRSDPGEKHNRYADPECREIRARLAVRLVEHEIHIQHELGQRGGNIH